MAKKKPSFIIFLGIILIAFFFLRIGIHPKSKTVSMDKNILCDFEDKRVWGISPERGFSLKLSRQHVSEGQHSLEVVYPKWNQPSINTKKLAQSWDNYDYFSFDVFNPQKTKIDFHIRLDDTTGKRTDMPYTLEPGLNKVKIAKDQIAATIDPEHIHFVVLYINEPTKRYRLYFDNMRLERSGIASGWNEQPSLSNALAMRKAVVLPGELAETKGEIKIALAKLKEGIGDTPLISTGVPFAPGRLTSEKDFAIYDQTDKEIPVAVKVLARWPQDRSIRSVLVQLRYKIPQYYEYAVLKWGIPRTTADLAIVEPNWEYPEGMIAMPAQWLCDSQILGEQVPFGQSASGDYDQNILKYYQIISRQPWTGNLREDGYYSTPHTFYQLYVRTGELSYFLAARKELLHYRDTQLVLDGPERGRSTTGEEPRYVYVEAMADDYFLTGDPRTLEVAGYMTEYLTHYLDPKKAFYPKGEKGFWTERLVASPMFGVLNYYEMTLDQKYLDLAKEYMDNLYKTQLQWPDRGGFIHNLYAHDPEEGARPDEYGGSPFMTGLLLEPIVEYHRITGSDVAADSIFRALDWLIKEGLVSSGDSFKYLTADKYLGSNGEPDVNLLIVHGFGYGYRLSGYTRKDYLLIGQKVFERGVREAYLEKQKHFNQNYRSSGHYLAYIRDGLQQAAAATQETAQNVLQDTALYEIGFESGYGRFSAGSDTSIAIDNAKTYLRDNSLRIQSNAPASSLAAGLSMEVWSIEDYPYVNFAYAIPAGTPVGMRVKTSFGDWICLGGTPTARCADTAVNEPVILSADGEWHEVKLNVGTLTHSILPGINQLSSFQFFTNGNADSGLQYWIDDFRINK